MAWRGPALFVFETGQANVGCDPEHRMAVVAENVGHAAVGSDLEDPKSLSEVIIASSKWIRHLRLP